MSLKNSKEELNVQLHQDGYFGAGQVSILGLVVLFFPSLSSVEEEESKLQLCDELMIRTLSRSKVRVEFVMMQTLELF